MVYYHYISEIDEKTKLWIGEKLIDESIENLCITFTKKDGTERELYCTLSESAIPEDKRPKGTGPTEITNEVKRVFDVEKQEWRSFSWNSVKKVSFKDKD